MKAINKLRERKAISPVIATVILVAVAITVAVGVSYWMSGIAGQYTSFEKIEIQSGYSDIQTSATDVFEGWIITLVMKNSGSATANLITVFVNDEPVDDYGATGILGLTDPVDGTGTNIPEIGLAIESGKKAIIGTGDIEVYIGSGLFSSGTTINVKIHSAGGMDYIKLVKLV